MAARFAARLTVGVFVLGSLVAAGCVVQRDR
jgi:outer membrane murein-binding lipoprotein Lpp